MKSVVLNEFPALTYGADLAEHFHEILWEVCSCEYHTTSLCQLFDVVKEIGRELQRHLNKLLYSVSTNTWLQ